MLVKPTRGAVLDRSHPLARGIVGYWLFNEGAGGKVYDLSGNSNYGTLYGDTAWAAGKFGSCLSFDRSGDYIDSGTGIDMAGWTGLTILAWLNYNGSSGNEHTIVSNWASGANKAQVLLRIEPSDHSIEAYALEDSDSQIGGSFLDVSITPNTWKHVVMTWDTTNGIQMHIDTIKSSTTYASSAPMDSDSSGNLQIGVSPHATGDYFGGLIDHVIIFNRALSASEIAWLYREPFAMISIPAPPLVVISAGGIINAEGQIDGTSSVSSTATVDWVVETSVSGTSSVTPDATVDWSAAVDVDASSTVTPDAVVDWGAVTQVDGESGLTVGAVVDWAAETTIGATSSVTPGATVDWSAATQIDATSSLTGTAGIGEVFVEGTIDATSSVTVGAIVDWAAETSIAAAATVAADLTGLFLLEVSIAAASSLTGTAQTGLLHSASGTISAVASIIGTLRNTRDANWTVDTGTTSITWQNVSEDNDITWTLE